MDLGKFDQYLADKENGAVEESSNEKKESMYREGAYAVSSAFREFSHNYMRGMGLMMQNKAVMNPKFKKLRDACATAYERMDDAISKHMEMISKDAEEKAKARSM